jgi:hypothetical protein
MKLLTTRFSRSLGVHVGHILVPTTIINLNFGLKSVCFLGTVLFIKATSASMFLLIVCLSLAMLSLMRMFSLFRHFRVLPHHHHITPHLLCLTSLKMLHTLLCCCLTMVQVLVVAHVFILRRFLLHLMMLLLLLLRRLRLLCLAQLPLSLVCPEWSLHPHGLLRCQCPSRLQLLGLRLMRPRRSPHHVWLRHPRRHV